MLKLNPEPDPHHQACPHDPVEVEWDVEAEGTDRGEISIADEDTDLDDAEADRPIMNRLD